MTEERGIVHVLDLMDGIKKGVAGHKDYIDKKIDFINKSIVNIEDTFDIKIKEFVDRFEKAVNDFTTVSDRSFLAVNTAKSLEDKVVMKDAWEKDLGTLVEKHAAWFKNIEAEVERVKNDFIEKYSVINDGMKQQDNTVYHLSVSVKDAITGMESILNKSEDLSMNMYELKKNLDKDEDDIKKCQEDIGNVDLSINRMEKTLDDVVRNVERNRSDIRDRLSKIESEVKEKAESATLMETKKDLQSVKDDLEKRPIVQDDVSRQSFDWQQQMEKKIARLEKKND